MKHEGEMKGDGDGKWGRKQEKGSAAEQNMQGLISW